MDIDRFTELAQKIMQVVDVERRYKAIKNLQQMIVEDIPDVITACTDLINENSKLRFGGYNQEIRFMFGWDNVHRRCINLLTNHFNDVREYESDTEEKRAERKLKLEEYSSTVTIKLPPKEVIYSSSGVTVIEREPDSNLIYCLHGTYRQYSEVCHSFEYRLCRTIQGSSGGDLKTLYQKVSLYIALRNEKAITADELLLLGIEVGKEDKNFAVTLPKELNAEEPPHYSKDEKEKATRQFDNLVKGGYFTSKTLLDDWLYIYGVQGKSPNKEPIDWQKTQKELAYMITRIWQNTDTYKWAIGEKVFTIKGKKPNIKVMKSDLSGIDNGYKNRPRTFDDLDEVLKT